MTQGTANRISNECAQKLAAVAARFPEVDVLYLFGSRAKGSARAGSDVDLAVLLGEQTDRERYFDLKRRLAAEFSAVAGDSVDVLILNETPLHVTYEAVAPRMILYEHDAAHWVEFEVQAVSRYFDFRPLLEVRKEYVKQQLSRGEFFG